MVNLRRKRRTGNQGHLASLHRGVTSIEYALLAALIAIAIVGAVSAAGSANAAHWSDWVGRVVAAIDAALGP